MKLFVEICHGCGKEVFTSESHYRAMLVDMRVYFHPLCYRYYIVQRGDVLHSVLVYEKKK